MVRTPPPLASRLRRVLLFALALPGIALGGCTIATPFRMIGGGAAGAGVAPDAQVVVVVTRAVIDPGQRRLFDQQVDRVLQNLPAQSGLIGYSIRRELFGDNAWTLTAWVDDASRAAFVGSGAHRAAMVQGAGTFVTARFARVTLPANTLPLTWNNALDILERDGLDHY